MTTQEAQENPNRLTEITDTCNSLINELEKTSFDKDVALGYARKIKNLLLKYVSQNNKQDALKNTLDYTNLLVNEFNNNPFDKDVAIGYVRDIISSLKNQQ